ncbi:MAG: hypothetical protein RLZZ558_317 [Planctomycetota bacterium]
MNPTARILAFLTLVPCVASCTGSQQMGMPWGSPMQDSTALPDVPYPPRDLAMFEGSNGRLVMWADLTKLVRISGVIVVATPAGSDAATAFSEAVREDVESNFQPAVVLDCDADTDACVDHVTTEGRNARRVLVRCPETCDLPAISRGIRAGMPGTSVTTVLVVRGDARRIRDADRDRADVIVYTGPARATQAAAARDDR